MHKYCEGFAKKAAPSKPIINESPTAKKDESNKESNGLNIEKQGLEMSQDYDEQNEEQNEEDKE